MYDSTDLRLSARQRPVCISREGAVVLLLFEVLPHISLYAYSYQLRMLRLEFLHLPAPLFTLARQVEIAVKV